MIRINWKLSTMWFLLYGLNANISEAGSWKSSLNFDFDQRQFNFIDVFHQGLSDAAQEETRVIPASVKVQGRNEIVTHDGKGNLLFNNHNLLLYSSITFSH